MQEQRYYYWHSQSVVVKELEEPISPTLAAAMGMGGANMTTPIFIVSARPDTQSSRETGKVGKQQR